MRSLPINRRIRPHKIRHIRNMDANLKVPILQFDTMQCIINILATWRIHRTDRQMPQIRPGSQFRCRNRKVNGRQAIQHLLAERAELDVVL